MESIEINPLEYGYELDGDDDDDTKNNKRNLTRRTTNAMQVCEMRKIKCMHLPYWQDTMLSILQF